MPSVSLNGLNLHFSSRFSGGSSSPSSHPKGNAGQLEKWCMTPWWNCSTWRKHRQSLQEESERYTTDANKIDQKMNEIYIPWICKLFDFCAGMFIINCIIYSLKSILVCPCDYLVYVLFVASHRVYTSTSFPATESLHVAAASRRRWLFVTIHGAPSFDTSRFYVDRTEMSWASLQQSSTLIPL